MPASDRSDVRSTSPIQRRAAVRYTLAIIAMIASISGAGNLMRLAAATAPDSPDPRFPVHYAAGASLPFPVVMDHEHGWTFLAMFFALVALLAIESLVAVRALRLVGRPAPALLVAGLVAVLAAMTLFPVTFSLDAYAYAAFGRLLGVHGLNPYVERLANGSSLGDPVLAALTSFLGAPLPANNYGPLWTWLAGFLALVGAPGGLVLEVWLQRLAAAVALVLAALGVMRLLRASEPGERAARTALFALHPLALYESAAAGHNDMLMIAPAVWAFALVDGAPFVAGVLIGAAIAVKYVAALALPFLAIRAAHVGGARTSWSVVVPAVALPAALFIPLWPGWAALSTLFALGSTLIMSPLWLAQMWLPFLGGRTIPIAFACAFGAIFIASVARYARDRCGGHLFRAVAALVLSSPLLNPWYVQWLLPAASSAGRWARYAWWFGLLVMLRYVEDALRFPSTQADLSARIALLEIVTVAIVATPFAGVAFGPGPAQRVGADDA